MRGSAGISLPQNLHVGGPLKYFPVPELLLKSKYHHPLGLLLDSI